MKEINNNIHNYGYAIDRINTNKDKSVPSQPEIISDVPEKNYVADTGVLGRSQVLNGGNITKSIDEAVDMAENHPLELQFCEDIFDTMYQNYIQEGRNESDAYMDALLGEAAALELLDMGQK